MNEVIETNSKNNLFICSKDSFIDRTESPVFTSCTNNKTLRSKLD